MNGTAFTAPGEGETVARLFDVLVGQGFDQDAASLRWTMRHASIPPEARTNIVLLHFRSPLTAEDLNRIAECTVTP